ncbi:hypothetical protein N0V84_012192 [Fusarium piperis]|uniref:Uncharacterized protein n=1 Tax=Fusarium piperis TaxID=1435070 RepID=A0A9W8TBY6_9HYPO|nr:hypothetical protein N0V84_012192 [Fusarium piperis]
MTPMTFGPTRTFRNPVLFGTGVPDAAFKSAYELQVCARNLDEGFEDSRWVRLATKARLILAGEGLLRFDHEDSNDNWDENDHVDETADDKSNQVDNGTTYWDEDHTSWDGDDNDDVDVNANVDQADNDNGTWGGNGILRWGSDDDTTWDGNGIASWHSEGNIDCNDSDSDKCCGAEPTPDPEVDNDCDYNWDSNSNSNNAQPIPDSATDRIVSAIDRNTNIVVDLCGIMEGIKGGLDRLHEDNVQSKKVLQNLLAEQRTLGEKLA